MDDKENVSDDDIIEEYAQLSNVKLYADGILPDECDNMDSIVSEELEKL